MSLRHADPERETITGDTVVFDDLTDAFVAIKVAIPDAVAKEKNGVGWDALVASFVAASKSLSRFEMTDERRFATDYIKQNDVVVATVGLLRWRCQQAKKQASVVSMRGDKSGRETIRKCIEAARAMLAFKQLAESHKKRVAQRRLRLNATWEEARPMREAERQRRREEGAAKAKEERERRRAENRALHHDRLKSRYRSIGPGLRVRPA